MAKQKGFPAISALIISGRARDKEEKMTPDPARMEKAEAEGHYGSKQKEPESRGGQSDYLSDLAEERGLDPFEAKQFLRDALNYFAEQC